jgi:o-succinylbenzoate---CoA ligase
VAFVRAAGRKPEELAQELEPLLPRFKIPISFYPWPEEAPRDMKADRAALGERARRLHRGV